MTRTLRTRAVLPDASGLGRARSVQLTLDHGLIVAIDPLPNGADVDHPHTVIPGFIDLQTNGIDDLDLWTIVVDDDLDAWSVLESSLLDQGVTTWCPTFISAPRAQYDQLTAFLDRLEQRPTSTPRPRFAGVHLEGPFLGSAIGAHSPEVITIPDLGWLTSIAEALTDRLALVTMGAESELAMQACRLLHERNIRVSLGHTTPTKEQYTGMCRAGATMVTHLFNGMGGIDHRRSGLASWALDDDDMWCGLIADGVHVDPSWIGTAFRVKPDRLILVTDRVADRRPDMVNDGRAVRRRDGTLAGSLLTMSAALRICTESAGVPVATSVFAATTNPARAMGWNDRGLLAVGRRADLVALDDRLDVVEVWMDGRRVR
ncbi:MAG: N-acetylglucosamine-6-phosphate deacetylase [Ilumatobacteraceae bacterium]